MIDPVQTALTAAVFKPWPKIGRWSKAATVVITEKLDGTNDSGHKGEAAE